MAEIQTLGYVGRLRRLGQTARAVAAARTPRRRSSARRASAPVASVFTRHVSPQIAAALLGQPRPLLTARQADTVDALKAQCPGFTTMRRLVLSFRTILRVGKVATLHRWLARAHATNIVALQRFVRTLRRISARSKAPSREPWSNGPVEGHINRLKMLRRQMYGRAGVELLRARLLPAPSATLWRTADVLSWRSVFDRTTSAIIGAIVSRHRGNVDYRAPALFVNAPAPKMRQSPQIVETKLL